MPRDLANEEIFTCPITKQIMANPVIGKGHAFEEEAILEWLKERDTNPVTNLPLTKQDLSPHYGFKELISKYLLQLNQDERQAVGLYTPQGNGEIWTPKPSPQTDAGDQQGRELINNLNQLGLFQSGDRRARPAARNNEDTAEAGCLTAQSTCETTAEVGLEATSHTTVAATTAALG